MSYYLLHLLNPHCYLKKQRGLLHCSIDGNAAQTIPLEDIRGVIIATEKLTITARLISELVSHGAFILHCNSKYQPHALTEPLTKIINRDVIMAQAKASTRSNKQLWQGILRYKIQSQLEVLQLLGAESQYLTDHLSKQKLNESSCSRYYWQQYFRAIEEPTLTRRHHQDHPLNAMLNYAYAVLGAICHRSIVGHGLSPLLGVQHKGHFHSYPLVYDLIEPLRSVIDWHLFQFYTEHRAFDISHWAKESRNCWQYRVKSGQNTLRLVDAIDKYVASVAKCFLHKETSELWIPTVGH